MAQPFNPEIVEEKLPTARKSLITIMVLSIALAHQVLGKNAPKGSKLDKEQGQKVVKAIEAAVRRVFPEVADLILGMFSVEMLSLMPLLQDPESVVKDMVSEYVRVLRDNAITSPESSME